MKNQMGNFRVSLQLSFPDNLKVLAEAPTLLRLFLLFQRYKVTVLLLLYCELHYLKLTRDYVTTLTNYKGWITYTTKVDYTILTNYWVA